MLDYEHFPCPETPQALMVWLHGLGADGFDLQPAAEMLRIPGICHVFPHAPVRPVTINAGMAMRAWYDIAAPDLRRQEDREGMLVSAQQVRELVGALRNHAATPLILAGFSQGAVLSLITAALGMTNLIGVVAMSGYVPQFMAPSLAGLQGVPVFMGHGEQDGVIPLALAQASRGILAGSGVEVDWHAYPMQHTIGQQELLDIEAWLKRRPGLAAAP